MAYSNLVERHQRIIERAVFRFVRDVAVENGLKSSLDTTNNSRKVTEVIMQTLRPMMHHVDQEMVKAVKQHGVLVA